MSYVNTIADLEARTYGLTGATGFNNQLLKQAGTVAGLHTGHASGGTDIGSGTSGISDVAGLYNKIYGQKVWSMLNRECNALSMISKRPYTSSGWRIMTERPAGGSGNSLAVAANSDDTVGSPTAANIGSTAPRADTIGGVPENAGLDTAADGLSPIAPTYTTLFTSPKIVAHQFNFSELAMEMAAIDDGIGDIRAQMREDMGKHHAEVQNKMLVMPFEFYLGSGGSESLDLLDRNYTSLLKVVSSAAEITQMDSDDFYSLKYDNNSGTDDADNTPMKQLYGTVRGASGSGFLDAQVDDNDDYSATGGRQLTLTLINKTLRLLREAGGSPKVILTGYDTIQTLADLLQAQERFMDRKEIVPTVNGVRGVKGAEVGFRVSTYYDIPLIPVAAMPQTSATSNAISDMLFLDTDHIWLSVMKPTQYFEDGISNGNPFGVGTLGNKALYRTIAEVGCSYFKGQGKITNLL
jgi:hypothetical protein|tara:strand:+ start:2962 stop:4359 length:1398 start_codon:yes stop_codon:yes gene_type:complete